MSKIPFKVSARTARLIGRENIASAKGAIIELVKNAYDADSAFCIVYIDNKYSNLVDDITQEDYVFLKKNEIDNSLLNRVYMKNISGFKLDSDISDKDKLLLRKELSKLSTIYIIDAGDGMTQKIIKDCWMTIGTDNKSVEVFTKNGRVKAGAKGIGRFALDKLGDHTEMTTIFNKDIIDTDDEGEKTNNCGYLWNVRWSDFEGDFKTIETVNAELTGFETIDFRDEIHQIISTPQIIELIDKYEINNGTVLKITDLRGNWEDFYVNQIYSDLEVLVPPQEERSFDIYLFSSSEESKYGEVKGSICDDYDYKLIAKADNEQNVTIEIHRNEFDLDLIAPDFFDMDLLQKSPYRKEDFKKKVWHVKKTLPELLPGFEDIDDENIFKSIGVFEFSLYFLKKTYSTPDAKKFFSRRFKSNERKDWMNKFGGLKLFRDNFRVRPYGEIGDSSFDWLGLGARKAKSPAGVAKDNGGYKVNPDNIAGAIKISRLTNVNFEDKSSRDGLQENKTFLIFKKVIAEIISVFENDRAYIARAMSKYYDEKYSDIINKKKAETLAAAILEKAKKDKENANADETQDKPSSEVILAALNKEKEEEIEKLKDEQKVLRGLASSGIVMASFTHELSNLDNVLDSRIDNLKMMISSKVTEKSFSDTPDYLNPFVLLEDMKRQDAKVQNWLKFSIGAAKKDKRTRKKLSLKSYFENFKITWDVVLKSRGITFSFDVGDKHEYEMRIFEIDLDSIFNNLLVNSIDAFLRSKKVIDRKISIVISELDGMLSIEYHDNGPGLSKDITNPEDIFEALYTTKRNKHTGEEEGTGLGMWLVRTISEDNDATAKILYPDTGFGFRISFPIKYKK